MTLALPTFLPSSHYIRMVRPEMGGAMALTHLAIVKDESGAEARAFVKHFPEHAYRGLFNEWFGYAMMSALGIPQPKAAVLSAPIPGTGMFGYAYVSFQPMPRSEGTPKEIYNLADAQHWMIVANRLLECHSYAGMIAADQLCINADRNLGNIVFTGKKSFVVIDHSEILGGNAWKVDDLLKTTAWVESQPLAICERFSKISKSNQSAICAAADVIAEQLWAKFSQIKSTLNPKGIREIDIALDAIWWRSLSVSQWFKNNFGVLI